MSTNNAWNSQDPVQVAFGGTGQTSIGSHKVFAGAGTGPVSRIGPGTAGQTLVGQSSNDPTYVTPTANTGLSITTNASTLKYDLTSPMVVTSGGTGATSFTANAVVCGGTTTTGVFQNVSGVGTVGQMLTSAGASALPTWSAASVDVGALQLVQTQTASSSVQLDFTYGITTVSPHYMVILSNIVPASNSVSLQMRFSNDGGQTFLTTGYTSGNNSNPFNSTTLTNQSSTANCPIGKDASETTSTFYSGIIWFYSLNTSNYATFRGNAMTATTVYAEIFGGNNTVTGVNALRFFMSSGNITSGTISLYQILT